MDLIRLLASMRRHRLLIAALSVAFALAAVVLAAMQRPSYEATSRVVLGPAADIVEPNDRIQVGQVLNHPVMAANLSEIITSDRVIADAQRDVGVDDEQIEEVDVSAVIAPESNVIEVVVAGPDEDLVVDLIEPMTAQGVVLFEEIYPVFRAEVIDLAPTADVSEPPGVIVAALIGLIVGFVVSIFAGLFVDAAMQPAPEIVRDRGPLLPRRLPTIDLSNSERRGWPALRPRAEPTRSQKISRELVSGENPPGDRTRR